jgi:hypothetical protein
MHTGSADAASKRFAESQNPSSFEEAVGTISTISSNAAAITDSVLLDRDTRSSLTDVLPDD